MIASHYPRHHCIKWCDVDNREVKKDFYIHKKNNNIFISLSATTSFFFVVVVAFIGGTLRIIDDGCFAVLGFASEYSSRVI